MNGETEKLFVLYSQARLCVARQGVEKEKEAWKETRDIGFRLLLPTDRSAGCVWGFGAGSSRCVGRPGGHGPQQTRCCEEEEVRVEEACGGQRTQCHPAAPHCLPWQILPWGTLDSPDLFRHFLERAFRACVICYQNHSQVMGNMNGHRGLCGHPNETKTKRWNREGEGRRH